MLCAVNTRARDIGLFAASGRTGPTNTIVDVAGVAVGHVTHIVGEGQLEVGQGPVRTGVTVIVPREEPIATNPVFAGIHRLNGNGEMTGSHWIDESGLLTSPIALTNTHAVGVVRDALIAAEATNRSGHDWWSLPVVAETWDGVLNDINGAHIDAADVAEALRVASRSGVDEGNVGGGTGMICHGFKGGVGTSSRAIDVGESTFTLGVLVQANQGARSRLVIDGHPTGRLVDGAAVPLPDDLTEEGMGSIITVIAADAPLLPHQCRSVAARAALGVGRVGGVGEYLSGDLTIAFATGNTNLRVPQTSGHVTPVAMADSATLTELYAATVDATEEAIVNALFAAETMVGRDGNTAHALPIDRVEVLVAPQGSDA
jgi:D-aminopeptidase